MFDRLKAVFKLGDSPLFLEFLILGHSQEHERFISFELLAFELQIFEEYLLVVRDVHPAQFSMHTSEFDPPLFPLSKNLKFCASASLMKLERQLDFQNTGLANVFLPPVHDPIQNESAQEVPRFDQLLPLIFASVVVQKPGIEK